jgi:hypothetical protein
MALEKVDVGEKGSKLIFDGLYMVVSESARTLFDDLKVHLTL